MRLVVTALLLAAASPTLADECDSLVDKVAAAAGAEVVKRSTDFANFTVASGTTLTLSCGGSRYPSSVGAQYRGEAPGEVYYATFGRAGEAVTGIAADVLRDAARRAQADATRLRHSSVMAGGARVTCSFTRSDAGALTMCAVIEQSDRS